jgi:hypothetical protein
VNVEVRDKDLDYRGSKSLSELPGIAHSYEQKVGCEKNCSSQRVNCDIDTKIHLKTWNLEERTCSPIKTALSFEKMNFY